MSGGAGWRIDEVGGELGRARRLKRRVEVGRQLVVEREGEGGGEVEGGACLVGFTGCGATSRGKGRGFYRGGGRARSWP